MDFNSTLPIYRQIAGCVCGKVAGRGETPLGMEPLFDAAITAGRFSWICSTPPGDKTLRS